MIDWRGIKSFEWDQGNIDKSYGKHGITPNQSEEIFLDDELQVVEDFEHSQKEARFIAIGKILTGKVLFVVFTVRKRKIRIISAREANRKERRKYAEKIKKSA